MNLKMNNNKIKKVAKFYDSRFDEYGNNLKTVGWSSKKSQNLRFKNLFRSLRINNKKILDVGCGLGDMVKFLDSRTKNYNYIGIDISKKLVNYCKKNKNKKNRKFINSDIFKVKEKNIDISVLSGSLSLNFVGIEDYTFKTMKKMFDISNECIALNFLSKYADYETKKNKHYYPERVFSWAKKISKNINLYHDYPLYEFTIQIYR